MCYIYNMLQISSPLGCLSFISASRDLQFWIRSVTVRWRLPLWFVSCLRPCQLQGTKQIVLQLLSSVTSQLPQWGQSGGSIPSTALCFSNHTRQSNFEATLTPGLRVSLPGLWRWFSRGESGTSSWFQGKLTVDSGPPGLPTLPGGWGGEEWRVMELVQRSVSEPSSTWSLVTADSSELSVKVTSEALRQCRLLSGQWALSALRCWHSWEQLLPADLSWARLPKGDVRPWKKAHRFVPRKPMGESQPGLNWVFRLVAPRLQEFAAPVCHPARLRLKSHTTIPGHGFEPPVCGHSVQRDVDTASHHPWGKESTPHPSASLSTFSGQPSSPHDDFENLASS